MKITKLGHCCLIIEENGLRILTDPGNFTQKQNEVTGIDVVLISHEHTDHFHVESVREVMKNNPNAKIVTNKSVAKLLDKDGFQYDIVGDGQSITIKGIMIEGFGSKHAEIYKEFGQVENTGYFIGPSLFYPGDSFYNPQKNIKILALPVAGPWMKLSEAITYALEIKPEIAFPVHDGASKSPFIDKLYSMFLEKENIKFLPLEIEKETDI